MLRLTPGDPFPAPDRPASIAAEWAEAARIDDLEVWRSKAALAASDRGYAWGYASRRQATMTALTTFRPPPARVLDVAAGLGNFSITASKLGYSVVWNDLRAQLIDYVRSKMVAANPLGFAHGNILELDGGHVGAYDAVVALEVIEHVAHPDRFLTRLAQLVKPGGVIVLTTPNGDYLRNDLPRFSDHPDPAAFESQQFKPDSDGHIFLLYDDELRAMAAGSGLKVALLEQVTSPLTAGYLGMRHLLRVLTPSWVCRLENAARRLPRTAKRKLMTHTIAVLTKPPGASA